MVKGHATYLYTVNGMICFDHTYVVTVGLSGCMATDQYKVASISEAIEALKYEAELSVNWDDMSEFEISDFNDDLAIETKNLRDFGYARIDLFDNQTLTIEIDNGQYD